MKGVGARYWEGLAVYGCQGVRGGALRGAGGLHAAMPCQPHAGMRLIQLHCTGSGIGSPSRTMVCWLGLLEHVRSQGLHASCHCEQKLDLKS